MVDTPLDPDCDEQSLEDACNGRGEECAPDAKEFGTCDQSSERDDGMQSNRFTDNTRPDDVALKDMYAYKIGEDDNCDEPALGQGEQDTDSPRNEGTQHRNEREDKGQD